MKTIQAGRLKGKSDINPQWRLEALTDLFGPVGIGWYTEITRREYREGANGEIACFVDINLYVMNGTEWSKPITGTGGSMFVAKEKNGMYTSDEAEKMAYTDAISVACKAIGIASNVYRGLTDTKYTRQEPYASEKVTPPQRKKELKEATQQMKDAIDYLTKGGDWEKIEKHYEVPKNVRESINNAVKAQLQTTKTNES